MHWKQITLWLPAPRSPMSSRFTLRTMLACVTLFALACPLVFRPTRRASSVVSLPTFQSKNPQDVKAFTATQLALLKSPFILNAAIRQLDKEHLPVELRAAKNGAQWIESRLDLTPQASSVTAVEVSISSKDGTAAQLQKLVESVVDAYENEIVSGEKKR